MKKILIMLSMIAVFACLFAISAFAATEIDGIWYDLSGSGENAVAKVTNDNATKCTLEDVVIPETVTYNDVTYTVTTIDAHAFSGAQSSWGKNQTVKSMVIPSTVTSIGSHFLRECKSVETVVIKSKSEAGITLYDAEFYNCTSLKTVDMSESDVVSFKQYTFYGCSELTTVKYPPRLNTIGGHCFRKCGKLTSVDISSIPVTNIGGGAFWDCVALTEIKFPSTLKSIGGNGIQETALTTIVFPHSLATLNNDAIANNRKLYMMVLPEIAVDNTNLHSGAIHDFYPKVVIYSGDTYEHLTGSGKLFASYKVEPFSNYNPTKTYTERTFFYGAKTCESCNGLLGEEYFDFDGFDKSMAMKKKCTHCDKENVTKDYGTIFTCLGYSTPENGKGGIVIGFKVNKEAIAVYKEKTGKSIEFGVFAIAQKNLGDGNVLNSDGSAVSGAIKAEISHIEVGSFDLVISGFKTEAQKTAMLALGAYVIATKDNESEIAYIQQGAPVDGSGYCFISYNDII